MHRVPGAQAPWDTRLDPPPGVGGSPQDLEHQADRDSGLEHQAGGGPGGGGGAGAVARRATVRARRARTRIV